MLLWHFLQRTFSKAKRIAAEKQLKASVLCRFVASFHEWVGLYNQKLNTFGLFFYSPKSWDSFIVLRKILSFTPLMAILISWKRLPIFILYKNDRHLGINILQDGGYVFAVVNLMYISLSLHATLNAKGYTQKIEQNQSFVHIWAGDIDGLYFLCNHIMGTSINRSI